MLFLQCCARRCSLAQNDLPNHQDSCSQSYVFACCARRCQKFHFPQFSVSLAASCISVNIFMNFSEIMTFYTFLGPEAIWTRKTKGLGRPRRYVFNEFYRILEILNPAVEMILRGCHQGDFDFPGNSRILRDRAPKVHSFSLGL